MPASKLSKAEEKNRKAKTNKRIKRDGAPKIFYKEDESEEEKVPIRSHKTHKVILEDFVVDFSNESESEDDSSEEEVVTKKSSNKRTREGKFKDEVKPRASKKKVAKEGKEGKGGKEEKKMMGDKEALKAIEEYMIKQNRPYSL